MALKISTAASPVCPVGHCLLGHDANSKSDTCLLTAMTLTVQMEICGTMTHAIILQNRRPVVGLVVSLPNTTQPLWSTLLTKLTCLLQQMLS